ncbi:unnamed protein product, partial [Closterium sp. NIES-53]
MVPTPIMHASLPSHQGTLPTTSHHRHSCLLPLHPCTTYTYMTTCTCGRRRDRLSVSDASVTCSTPCVSITISIFFSTSPTLSLNDSPDPPPPLPSPPPPPLLPPPPPPPPALIYRSIRSSTPSHKARNPGPGSEARLARKCRKTLDSILTARSNDASIPR